MINEEKLTEVWIPTKNEWNKYISKKIKQKSKLDEEIKELIRNEYTKLDNIFASISILKQPYYKNKEYANMVAKHNIYNSNKLGTGWAFLIQKKIKEALGKEISKTEIKKYLKEENLPSLMIKYNETTKNGWLKAQENSKSQEKKTKEALEAVFPDAVILDHRAIIYVEEGSKKIKHKIPDFIVIREKQVIIVECKLEQTPWESSKEQLYDYVKLVKRLTITMKDQELFPIFVCKNVPEKYKYKRGFFDSIFCDEYLNNEENAVPISYGIVDDNESYKLESLKY